MGRAQIVGQFRVHHGAIRRDASGDPQPPDTSRALSVRKPSTLSTYSQPQTRHPRIRASTTRWTAKDFQPYNERPARPGPQNRETAQFPPLPLTVLSSFANQIEGILRSGRLAHGRVDGESSLFLSLAPRQRALDPATHIDFASGVVEQKAMFLYMPKGKALTIY